MAAARPLSIACCDAFALQRIYQAGGVADQEDTIAYRRRADESHLEPGTKGPLPTRRGVRGLENSDARGVFEERAEVARGTSGRGPVREHADAEADVRAVRRRRGTPSRIRGRLRLGPASKT